MKYLKILWLPYIAPFWALGILARFAVNSFKKGYLPPR